MTQFSETSTVQSQQAERDEHEEQMRGEGRMQSGGMQSSRGYELITDQGRTSIGDNVVAKIAAISTREVQGVHQLNPRGTGGMVSGLAARVTGGDSESAGVNVEVGEREAAIDLAITVNYGVNIAQVSDAVRKNVINRVQSMTGLAVKEVNIDVQDLFFPEEAARQQQAERRVE